MRFILLSRHTNGTRVPDEEREQNLKDLGAWLALLRAELALPTRGGKSVTAAAVTDYDGDLGGVIVFTADTMEQAIALAQQSPGLKYGFTHEVFPEIALSEAAKT
jgi:hypothetical protein